MSVCIFNGSFSRGEVLRSDPVTLSVDLFSSTQYESSFRTPLETPSYKHLGLHRLNEGIFLSVCLPACLSVCQPVCLSVCLSVSLSVCTAECM